jgi:hypothetical protein
MARREGAHGSRGVQVIDTFAIWFEVAEHCAKLEAEPFPRFERRELGCVD